MYHAALPWRDMSESLMYVDHVNDEPLEVSSFSGECYQVLYSLV